MKRQLNIQKTTRMAMVINLLQILLVLGLSIVFFIKSSTVLTHLRMVRWFVLFVGLLISWGAFVDIRQAMDARRISKQRIALENTLESVEKLNHVLRAQRHDFLNHLQAVYGLIEMEEYEEANDYIENVYGNIRSVSQMLRTANPSVNALLHVKLAQLEEKNIQVTLHIKSAWEALPVPGWEMCRVLGNILDNAMEALENSPSPSVVLELTEDLKDFTFSISNNGPVIPKETQQTIFLPNVTTKLSGQGMGLFISSKILNKWGGSLSFTSEATETVFTGKIPRTQERFSPQEPLSISP
ncbi:MAG: GHKL domain-containing protein [Clostridiales bacterium]|nr:GHKL domain-containing protein [Clostridiales bacterium]